MQVRNLILLVVSVYFICKYVDSDIPTDHFLLNNIFIPLFVYNIIMILCTAYYIFALTQNTVRFLYVEVFYVNIFRKLVVIFFCTYMLVVIFSPHHFYVSSSREVITFNNAYLIFAAAILSYALFDSGLVITYICAIYFRYIWVQRKSFCEMKFQGTEIAELSVEVLVRPAAHHDWS